MVSNKSSEKGFALIVTLLITAILVGVVVEVIYRVYLSSSRVANFTNSQKAALLARASVDITRVALEGLMKENPYKTMDGEGWSFSHREEDTVITVSVFGEQGRASTRIVYPQTGAANDRVYETYRRLLTILEQDELLAEGLADWIDGDDEPRPAGGEGIDYYQHLPRPYMAKNNYLHTSEELLMVKGYTPEIFKAIAPFITVYSSDGYININTAQKEVLMALSEDVTEDLAQRIIDFRNDTPFHDKSDIMRVSGFESLGFTLQNRITVDSSIFRIFAVARTADAVREVEAVTELGGKVLYWREM